MKKWFISFRNWLLKNRYTTALYMALFSVVFSLFFGGILTFANGDFFKSVVISFLFFFAFPLVGALLILCTKMKDDYCFGYGAALYYGTVVVSNIFKKLYQINSFDCYVIGFIFTVLICYITWLKYFKKRHNSV